ncbi:hypothetical protein ADICYQ_3918 [Cyclobacterium qasimii M12-11B]|uniref:Uncharacterized protein n=1 Tax=Cyclobacterium qasimii M12-11B TaxID=641524 RepID=S7WSG2_9BACT|nr:hypothetical protein ADICYQ_3918 [Cyclobacterium qasimii M12-11B]
MYLKERQVIFISVAFTQVTLSHLNQPLFLDRFPFKQLNLLFTFHGWINFWNFLTH